MMLRWLAFVRGRLHCWRWHRGGRAVLDTHYGRSEIFCPMCGRVFWWDDQGGE